MGNTNGLGDISDILALGELDVGVHGLPVVGDEEHSVGSLQRRGERVNGAQIGLFEC